MQPHVSMLERAMGDAVNQALQVEYDHADELITAVALQMLSDQPMASTSLGSAKARLQHAFNEVHQAQQRLNAPTGANLWDVMSKSGPNQTLEQQIDEVFRRWDADKSGNISLPELNHVLQWFFRDGEQAGQTVMQMADTNGDGVVSREELGAWLYAQENAGGPAVSSFVPMLLARLREEEEMKMLYTEPS